THDEDGVMAALHGTLARLIPVDRLELIVPGDLPQSRVRTIRIDDGGQVVCAELSSRSRRLGPAAEVLAHGQPRLVAGPMSGVELQSGVWVPVVEGQRVRAVLAVQAR